VTACEDKATDCEDRVKVLRILLTVCRDWVTPCEDKATFWEEGVKVWGLKAKVPLLAGGDRPPTGMLIPTRTPTRIPSRTPILTPIPMPVT
jgi:hypothetical protein